MESQSVKVIRIEDHEGDGRCTQCGRDSLRWIAVLSDGSRVGTECARRLGIKIGAPKSLAWLTDFRPVATHVDGEDVWTLYQHRRDSQTRATRNGILVMVGGATAEWARRRWL